METTQQYSDQELAELFSDLIPAPSKLHLVLPRHEGVIEMVGGARSGAELLQEKGALVVATGIEIFDRFEGGLGVGDRVFLNAFSPEFLFDREDYHMIVVDMNFVCTFQKAKRDKDA